MLIEAAYIKPLVDAILGLVKKGSNAKLQHDAAKAVREAIRELLLVDPNQNLVETKLAIAKAAGLISQDVLLADEMLEKVRSNKKKLPSKTSRKKVESKTVAVKKEIKKETKVVPKKTAKKSDK
jgi:hypothetical protein